jgi:hypothetical protein
MRPDHELGQFARISAVPGTACVMAAGTISAALSCPSGSRNSAGLPSTANNDAAVLGRLQASVPPEMRLPRLPARDLALVQGG